MDLSSFLIASIFVSAIFPLVVIAVVAFVLFKFLWPVLRQNAGPAAKKMKDPVEGEFLLTGSSVPARNAAYQMCSVTGVISAPGMPSVPTNYQGLVPSSKFPRAGQTLPILVDRANPDNFVIEWDKVAAGAEKAMSAAQTLADEMNRRRFGG